MRYAYKVGNMITENRQHALLSKNKVVELSPVYGPNEFPSMGDVLEYLSILGDVDTHKIVTINGTEKHSLIIPFGDATIEVEVVQKASSVEVRKVEVNKVRWMGV